jgi:hypothetical protein
MVQAGVIMMDKRCSGMPGCEDGPGRKDNNRKWHNEMKVGGRFRGMEAQQYPNSK